MYMTDKEYKTRKVLRSIKYKAINILFIAVAVFVFKYSKYGYDNPYYVRIRWTDSTVANVIMLAPFVIMGVLLAALHYSMYRDHEKQKDEEHYKYRK